MPDQGPEIIRNDKESNFPPESAKAVKSFKDDLAENPEAVIAREIRHMEGFNPTLLELLRADANAANEELITGGAVCYGFHRAVIERSGGVIPDLETTIKTYFASEHDTNDPAWSRNRMQKLEGNKPLARALREITKYNPAKRFFYLGALEVKSIFDAYYEAEKVRLMASL